MSGSDVLRRELGEAQAALMRCLVHAGPVPPGFDPAGLLALRGLLLAKRRELVRRAAPQLAELLGADFEARFEAFRATRPCGAPTGRADAEAFATWLVCRGLLGAGAPLRASSGHSGRRRKRILDTLSRGRTS